MLSLTTVNTDNEDIDKMIQNKMFNQIVKYNTKNYDYHYDNININTNTSIDDIGQENKDNDGNDDNDDNDDKTQASSSSQTYTESLWMRTIRDKKNLEWISFEECELLYSDINKTLSQCANSLLKLEVYNNSTQLSIGEINDGIEHLLNQINNENNLFLLNNLACIINFNNHYTSMLGNIANCIMNNFEKITKKIVSLHVNDKYKIENSDIPVQWMFPMNNYTALESANEDKEPLEKYIVLTNIEEMCLTSQRVNYTKKKTILLSTIINTQMIPNLKRLHLNWTNDCRYWKYLLTRDGKEKLVAFIDNGLESLSIFFYDLKLQCVFMNCRSNVNQDSNLSLDLFPRDASGYYVPQWDSKDSDKYKESIHDAMDSLVSIMNKVNRRDIFHLKLYFNVSDLEMVNSIQTEKDFQDKINAFYCCLKDKISSLWTSINEKFLQACLGVKIQIIHGDSDSNSGWFNSYGKRFAEKAYKNVFKDISFKKGSLLVYFDCNHDSTDDATDDATDNSTDEQYSNDSNNDSSSNDESTTISMIIKSRNKGVKNVCYEHPHTFNMFQYSCDNCSCNKWI